MLSALHAWHSGYREVAIVGPLGDPRTQALLRAARQGFRPNQVLAILDPASPDAETARKRVPLLAGKNWTGTPTAYVCENYACQLPTTDAEKLRKQLED